MNKNELIRKILKETIRFKANGKTVTYKCDHKPEQEPCKKYEEITLEQHAKKMQMVRKHIPSQQ